MLGHNATAAATKTLAQDPALHQRELIGTLGTRYSAHIHPHLGGRHVKGSGRGTAPPGSASGISCCRGSSALMDLHGRSGALMLLLSSAASPDTAADAVG